MFPEEVLEVVICKSSLHALDRPEDPVFFQKPAHAVTLLVCHRAVVDYLVPARHITTGACHNSVKSVFQTALHNCVLCREKHNFLLPVPS